MKTDRHRLCLLISLALVVLMPSSDSLWVDEAQTWAHVSAVDFGTWLQKLTSDGYSETLMPLGMFFAWVGGKIFGTSEWALRAPNLIWTFSAVIAFWRIGLLWRTPLAPVVFAVQPFVWFYADEARPYALQIACGAWLALSLIESVHRREIRLSGLLVLLGSSLVLIATTLFGVVTVSAVALAYVWSARKARLQLPPKWRVWIGSAVILTGMCGVYYYFGLRRGATGAKLWSPGISNIAFAFYEFGGFTGLGPGREQLREIARVGGIAGILNALRSNAVPIVALALFDLAALARLRVFWKRNQHRDLIVALGGVLVLVVLATTALAFVAKFPFWGRHIAPVFPFFVALMVLALLRNSETLPAIAGWRLKATALGLFLFSSIEIRFAERHRKDDYKNAAALALKAIKQGESVWWVADPQAGRYYGLDLAPSLEQGSKAILLVTHKNVGTLTEQPLPDMVAFSKPDIYDDSGTLRRFLASNSFQPIQQLKAFTIWRKQPIGTSPNTFQSDLKSK